MRQQAVFRDGGRPCGSAAESSIKARLADEEADIRGQHYRPYHQTMNPIWQVGTAVLWLGGWHCANDWELMEEHNIKHVVNCTGPVPSHPDLGRKGGTTFYRFMVTRGAEAPNVLDFFRPVFEGIVAALAAGKSVLIHCRAGAHRAGTTACAAIMHLAGLGAEDATRLVKKSRQAVHISGDFQHLLKRLQEDILRAAADSMTVAAPAAGHPAALPAAGTSASSSSSAALPPPKAMPRPKRVGPLPPPLTPEQMRFVSGADPREPSVAPEPAVREDDSPAIIPIDLEPSSEEDTLGTVAAPAAGATPRFQKGWVDNPGAKLLMLSWNPGAGCRNMMDRIGSSGYNVVVLQEAQEGWVGRFPPGWVVQIQQGQLCAARAPVRIRKCGRLGGCFSLHAISAII